MPKFGSSAQQCSHQRTAHITTLQALHGGAKCWSECKMCFATARNIDLHCGVCWTKYQAQQQCNVGM